MKVKNIPEKQKKQDHLSKSQWDTFNELGYLELGPCLNKKVLRGFMWVNFELNEV